MKIIKKVNRLDVKRAFIITPYIRKFGIAGRYANKLPNKTKYISALKKAERAVNKLSEDKLDKIIAGLWKKRLKMYNKANWFIGTVATKEVGVWKGAGGLPIDWTRGSLQNTADKVRTVLKTKDGRIRARSRRAIPAIIHLKSVMRGNKYLLPIIFKSGTGTNGRKGLKKMKGDLDDGNMRSIALAVSGEKKLKVYIGVIK